MYYSHFYQKIKSLNKFKEKKKRVEDKFNEIIFQQSIYFDQFNIIAEWKSYTHDDYGDEVFNDKAFEKELETLSNKLYPTNSAYSIEIRNKLRRYAIDNFKKGRYTNQTNILTGEDFEISLATLFKLKGYIVTLTSKTGDQGADLIMEKNGKKIIVQAKYYTGNVGNDAVQQVNSAVSFYNANEGWVITNSNFTPSAIKLATKLKIKLINGHQLKTQYNYF